MKNQTWFEKMVKSYEKDFDYRLETLILDITEAISKKMEENNVNRTRLAELLKISPPAVTKILNGSSNFTLRTLLSLGDALDLKLEIGFREKETIPQKTSFQNEYPLISGPFSWTDVTSGTADPNLERNTNLSSEQNLTFNQLEKFRDAANA